MKFTIERLREIAFGPSGETKTEIMLRTAKEMGLQVINIKCAAVTDEDRKGIPVVKN